jgi:PAS domain S-box-containing protein
MLGENAFELFREISLLHQVNELAQVGYAVWELEREQLRWSPVLESFYGLELGTFSGNHAAFFEQVHPEDRDYVMAEVRRAISESGVPYSFQCRPIAGDRWLSHKGYVLLDATGRAVKMIEIVTDVSELRRVENQVLAPASKARMLLSCSSDLLLQLNAEGEICDVSPMPAGQMTFTTLPWWELPGRSIYDLIEPSDRRLFEIACRHWFQGEANYLIEFRGTSANPLHFEALGNLYRTENSEEDRAIVSIRDISQRKRAEQTLEFIFGNAAMGINITDATGRIIDSNRAFQNMLGYSAAELKTMTYVDYTHPDDLHPDEQQFSLVMQNQKTVYSMEKRFIRRDGSSCWGRLTVSGITHNQLTHTAISIIEDITEQKLLAQRLRSLAETMPNGDGNPPDGSGTVESISTQIETQIQVLTSIVETMLASTVDGVLVIYRNKILKWNQKLQEMWNLDAGVLQAGNDDALIEAIAMQIINPDDFREIVLQENEYLQSEEYSQIETIDGRRIQRYSRLNPNGLRVVFYREI